MQVSSKRASWIQRNNFIITIIPMLIGLHIGWYVIQQRYVPEAQRHEHPVMRIYKRFMT